MKTTPFLLLSVVGCVALTPAASAQTISPRRAFGRYQQLVWTEEHGLPQSSVLAITRTRDGYLWLATYGGVARFDGVKFTVFDTATTPEMTTSLTQALLEDRRGTLWIGTDGGGLLRYEDGRFTRYTTREGLSSNHVYCLLEDREGNLWIGTDGGGLNRFNSGTIARYTHADGLPDDQVWALAEDRDGALWIGTTAGLARLAHDRFTVFTTRDGIPHNIVRSLSVDRRNVLWIGTNDGLARFADGRFAPADARHQLMRGRVNVVYHDREDILWVGTEGAGLYRREGDGFTVYRVADGLPGGVTAVYQDPDSHVWIGTSASGVAQLRLPRIRTFAARDGLEGSQFSAVFGDAEGRLWIGSDAGLIRFEEGRGVTFSMAVGSAPAVLRTIAQDRAGQLWMGSANGLERFASGRERRWTTRDGLSPGRVTTVLADRDGTLWVGTHGGGLNRFRDGHFTVLTTRDGLPDDFLLALFQDRAGDIWIGTRGGGMGRLHDGHFTTWTTKEGLGSMQVNAFYEDKAGALWVGTEGGGLSRLRNGRLATVNQRDGLYDNVAFSILEDDVGNLWMSGNRGIYRASLKELNEFADGRRTSVSSFAYGMADGMLSRECNGGSPAGWKTPDGLLWFATIRGLVSVDPSEANTRPPLVAIETVAVDRTAVRPGDVVRLVPGQTNLEITYTALTWTRPKEVRFKYRLAGIDHTWIDAGARRTAFYSRLPPGTYRFTVIADNGDGVWNEVGRSLAVTVVPAFYQTRWFLVLVSLAVMGAIAAAWRVRVRQLQRAQAIQQAFSAELIASQERERKRIATELHDGLGQNLLIIRNHALLHAMRHPGSEANAPLTEVSELVSHTIDEVRAIAWNLRPSHLDQLGLRTALIAMIEKVGGAGQLVLEHDIDVCDDLLPSDQEIIVYRIVQECVTNVVKHARATRAMVALTRDEASLVIGVRDNGKGFDLVPVSASSYASGGFGLTGIAERVRMLGGTHTITSAAGEGTAVVIRLPVRPGQEVSAHA